MVAGLRNAVDSPVQSLSLVITSEVLILSPSNPALCLPLQKSTAYLEDVGHALLLNSLD